MEATRRPRVKDYYYIYLFTPLISIFRDFKQDSNRPVGNAFGGIEENAFCDDAECQRKRENRKASRQNGMMFSTIDRDNDRYCQLVFLINLCFLIRQILRKI